MKMAVIAAALLAGCVKTGANVPQISTGSDVKASYLVVGMEHSGRFGDCPGCELDARMITNMIKSQGYSGETLVSDKATKSDVVKKLIEEVCQAEEKVLKDPAVFVRTTDYGAGNGVKVTMRAWTKTAQYWDTYFDVLNGVRKAFEKNNIVIPFNQLDVHIKNS